MFKTDIHDLTVQRTKISMLLSDPNAWTVCQPKFLPCYFGDGLKHVVKYINNYCNTYGSLPSTEQIQANTGVAIAKFSEPAQHTSATIAEYEQHIQYTAMIDAVLDAVDLIDQGKTAEVVANISEASQLTLSTAQHPFDGLWIDECATVEAPDYLIGNWLVRDTVTCVYGAPGSYKSFFCLEAAFCLATGTAFAGHAVEQTCVAYVAAEGQRGIAMRLEALAEVHHVRADRNSCRLITQPINLLDDAQVSQFIQYLRNLETREGIDFGLVILDTYSQCIAGADENAQAVASKASGNMIRIRRELETTVIYVHHTGKDAARGMRGSDALRANTDGALEITRDEQGNGATAIVVRSKDARTGERIRFNMKFHKIPRLVGREFDGSLVPEFVSEEPITLLKLPGKELSVLEDALRVMEPEQVVSMKQLLLLMHVGANTYYKDKLAGKLPFDVPVVVRDRDGIVIGELIRVISTRTNNQYGDIKCLSKSA